MTTHTLHRTGIVVIGRNEGQRLRKALESAARESVPCVYVDSGSTDGSSELARSLGADVVDLDPSLPFTAARARNEGFAALLRAAPGMEYVQFLDGDCELVPGWLARASEFLEHDDSTAAVCGRLRERFPDKSIYNLLCDLEWRRPAGETQATGGIVMMRARAFGDAGGFRTDVIAGEEPELCIRIRSSGWRIWRLADEMAWHDAELLHFRQWWIRMIRAGHAHAQGADLHGAGEERHGVRETRSAYFWGFALPAAVLLTAAFSSPAALLMTLIYPLQMIRLSIRLRREVQAPWTYATFLVIGKFPEAIGALKYHLHATTKRTPQLIEYK